MPGPEQFLGGVTPAQFLRDYWQKEPVLIRQAIPGFETPLSPDELAGLACEDGIESRLVLEKDGAHPWQLEHGPFPEERFTHLPATHWTLLVQECNKYVPELALLLERFNFIPSWRIDDVMVSYAPAHGSVGPHVDQYDVFLLQAYGRRRWQISTQPVATDNVLPDTELCIMRDFLPEQEWVLEPGDMLYLPPGIAHYGVALDECMTFSIGFRAPSAAEILTDFTEYVHQGLSETDRYTDPDLRVPVHPGEISPTARARVRAMLRDRLADDAYVDDWFGRFITEPHVGQSVAPPEVLLDVDAFKARLLSEGVLLRSEYCRFAYIAADDGVRLYVDGDDIALPPQLAFAAPLLSDRRRYVDTELAAHLDDAAFLELLTRLYNRGAVYFADED